MLPERRGTVGRRRRRFGGITRQTFSCWVLMLTALFLIYLAFFVLRILFHVPPPLVEDKAQDNSLDREVLPEEEDKAQDNSLDREVLAEEEPDFNDRKPPKSKHRRQHHPCQVGFVKSVDRLVEPERFINYTRFSLEFIDKEQSAVKNELLRPKFGGHQTLMEREKSFHANDQTLHCGFVRGLAHQTSGFDLDGKDKAYMNTCKVAVSSCIFGSSDFLRRPNSKVISEYTKKNVCFVMFVDEQTLVKLSVEGNIPDSVGNVGIWRIVVVKNLPYVDMRRTGKVPKLLSHRLFPNSRYSIWLDSKLRLQVDPMQIIEYFLWRKRSEYAISNHYDRHCVWDEVQQNKRLNKYNHTTIDEQFIFYQSDGLTKFNPSRTNNLLPSYVPEGSFIVRAHTPMSNLFSCLWFNEVDRFTSRDQLSFAYTYLKLRRTNPDRPFYLHMFKDCERRALAKLFRHRILPSTPPAQ